MVLHASRRGIGGNAVVPNQALQRVILSTDVYPHNPAEIDLLFARISHADSGGVVLYLCVAFAAGNPGR